MVGAALFTKIVQHESRLAAIEANRYTAKDAHDAQVRSAQEVQAVWKEIASIRENLAKMPKEVPPQWFLDRVDGIEREIRELRSLIVQHERNQQ